MTTLLALFMIQSSRISPVLIKTHTKMNIALAKNNKYFFFPCRGLTSTDIVRRNEYKISLIISLCICIICQNTILDILG